MKIFTPIIAATALTLVVGLSFDATCNASTEQVGGLNAAEAASFHQPQLGGVNIDVRMMSHMRADPTRTAERFCRDQGFSQVADLVVRPSATTRTIADGTVHADNGETKQAFALIVCRTHHAVLSATS